MQCGAYPDHAALCPSAERIFAADGKWQTVGRSLKGSRRTFYFAPGWLSIQANSEGLEFSWEPGTCCGSKTNLVKACNCSYWTLPFVRSPYSHTARCFGCPEVSLASEFCLCLRMVSGEQNLSFSSLYRSWAASWLFWVLEPSVTRSLLLVRMAKESLTNLVRTFIWTSVNWISA